MKEVNVTMEEMMAFCKSRGFVFPGSDIYGGLANAWDYGPLGVELKRNIKNMWWTMFVTNRLDMVGLDSSILMNSAVWQASGHVETFTDPLVECKNCHERYRADHIDTTKACQKCGQKETFTEPASFNLMFRTSLGAKEGKESEVFLRPETAQGIFVDFPHIVQSSRRRVPFGVAQIGKSFRNEITPGNFIFRTREFEQMEIEYFVHPNDWETHFEKWRLSTHAWLKACGISLDLINENEIAPEELAHYSKRTIDFEFQYPFGLKELYGLAYRTDFDLRVHMEASGKDLRFTDPNTGEKYLPHIIEPSYGVDRTFLAVLLSSYTKETLVDNQERTVLRLPYELAPIKIAILPLSKKDELLAVSLPIAEKLAKNFRVEHDETQSIGKRYRRQDEIGTPFCVTVDFDSLEDKAVTVRNRDTMQQIRVSIDELEGYLKQELNKA